MKVPHIPKIGVCQTSCPPVSSGQCRGDEDLAGDLNPQFDRKLAETLHRIIARITVFPNTDQGFNIEVAGWLQSLIGVVPGHVGELW